MPKNRKLELALRKNRGSNILYEWTQRLVQACQREVLPEQFLPLEETERLRSVYSQKVASGEDIVRRNFPKGQLGMIERLFRTFSERLDPEQIVVLFSSVDYYVGAVQLPAEPILRNLLSVWGVVEEDLRLATLDMKNGLCLEVNFNDMEGKYVKDGVYEISVWGVFGQVDL
jgi:hypothetical protein